MNPIPVLVYDYDWRRPTQWEVEKWPPKEGLWVSTHHSSHSMGFQWFACIILPTGEVTFAKPDQYKVSPQWIDEHSPKGKEEAR